MSISAQLMHCVKTVFVCECVCVCEGEREREREREREKERERKRYEEARESKHRIVSYYI